MRAYNKFLFIQITSKKLHLASPFLFYNIGFECVLNIYYKPLMFMGHLGTLWWYFSEGRFIEFCSRW